MIQSCSLQTLEFPKVLEVYQRCLRTPLSRPLLMQSSPVQDADWLQTRFSELHEARELLESGRHISFDGIGDVWPVLAKAALPGSFCEGIELVRLLDTLRGIRLLRKSLLDTVRPLESLLPYTHRIHPMEDFESRLSQCFEPDGTLKDKASPGLARIRERIRRLRAHIQKRLEELCRRSDVRALLQEDYFTERGGRYVLPIQSAQKRRLPGIQHGKSTTGTTVYIEPMDLVEPGNLLGEALEEESLEQIRILKELTALLRERMPILQPTLDAVAELDLVVSLADYSLLIRSSLPSIVPQGDLVLREIRHPLLLARMPHEQVVHNDLILEQDCSGLMITGPNTGGKTVVIKTAGLACLLGLSGLPFPCGEGTVLPILGGVLADIGDDQSIEESLSTFSSHVSRMKTFQEVADRLHSRQGARLLVILDELGAGTDPAEGAALGRALLEYLIERGAWVLVATHLGELKLFGYSRPELKSGAMLFDHQTLSPTYQMRMDSVGESHGLEIAERLGIAESIIKRAEELLSTNPNQSVALLHRLSEEEKKVQDIRLELESLKIEAEEKKESLVRRLDQTAREEKRIIEEARRQAEQKIQSARRRMASIEEHIHKQEQKLREGYDWREKGLEQREEQVTWMERELQRRLGILADLARKFPNFTPALLKPTEIEKLQRLAEPDWQKILRKINDEEQQIRDDFPRARPRLELAEEARPAWQDITSGSSLQIEGVEGTVSVLEKDEKRKRVAVLLGNLRMEIPYARILRKISGKPAETPAPRLQLGGVARSDAGPEINLIGMTLEEMEPVLVRYLDDAALSGRPTVRIIHGHGTGTLRKGVQRILRDHPQVTKFHEAESFEGGAGATIALLRNN